MESLIAEYRWAFLIVVMGSFVDLCQFVWIMKRSIKKWRRSNYNRAKQEVMLDMAKLLEEMRIRDGNNQPVEQKE